MSVGHRGIKNPQEYVKSTRLFIGFSQRQLAQSMCVSPQTIHFWEKGHRNTSPIALEWLAAARVALGYARGLEREEDWESLLLYGGLSALIEALMSGVEEAGLSGLLQKVEEIGK